MLIYYLLLYCTLILLYLLFFFFFNDPPPTEFSPLPLPAALPFPEPLARVGAERVGARQSHAVGDQREEAGPLVVRARVRRGPGHAGQLDAGGPLPIRGSDGRQIGRAHV